MKQTIQTNEKAGQQSRPALAVTYDGGEPLLFEQLLQLAEHVEISPDSISQIENNHSTLNPAILAELKQASSRTRFLVHGVGLSIASANGYCESYLRLVDEIFSQLPVAWHSEHLGYTTVEGEHLGTMLPPPRTTETLDMLSERICRIQQRYQVPFLVENIVRFLPDYPGEYSEAEFLNKLTRNTGCGLILDIYNLECDQENFGFNVEGFLRDLDLSRVREMHLAGGVHDLGFRLDVHSRVTQDSTRALAGRVLSRAPNVDAVTFEYLKEAVPHLGYDAICFELRRLREELLYEHVG